ncbi:MAG: phosphoglycerate dehydrogenase [candidate division NC10 bacterium]|nr:phosphoglycerate dehydrogenase [candidate division NC10 bacterium]
MPKVLITSRLFGRTTSEGYELLEREGIEFKKEQDHQGDWSEEEIIAALQGYQGMILGADEPMTRKVLSALPELKVLSRHGVGFDNIDVAAATERGIVVAITAGANDNTVADLTMGLIISVARHIPYFDRFIRAGGFWKRKPGEDVHGKTLGLIGMGRIGKAVARRASGFDMKILAHDQVHDEAFAARYGIEYLPLDEVLSRADFVSIHLPSSLETRRLIGERELKKMKPSAYLINTSRGSVVDEGALIRALREGWIAGAGLDVLENEPPPPDHPLFALENVVLTPHIGGASLGAMRAMSLDSAANAIRVLRGELPTGMANPEVWR